MTADFPDVRPTLYFEKYNNLSFMLNISYKIVKEYKIKIQKLKFFIYILLNII